MKKNIILGFLLINLLIACEKNENTIIEETTTFNTSLNDSYTIKIQFKTGISLKERKLLRSKHASKNNINLIKLLNSTEETEIWEVIDNSLHLIYSKKEGNKEGNGDGDAIGSEGDPNQTPGHNGDGNNGDGDTNDEITFSF